MSRLAQHRIERRLHRRFDVGGLQQRVLDAAQGVAGHVVPAARLDRRDGAVVQAGLGPERPGTADAEFDPAAGDGVSHLARPVGGECDVPIPHVNSSAGVMNGCDVLTWMEC